jgi:hypothetical protein
VNPDIKCAMRNDFTRLHSKKKPPALRPAVLSRLDICRNRDTSAATALS